MLGAVPNPQSSRLGRPRSCSPSERRHGKHWSRSTSCFEDVKMSRATKGFPRGCVGILWLFTSCCLPTTSFKFSGFANVGSRDVARMMLRKWIVGTCTAIGERFVSVRRSLRWNRSFLASRTTAHEQVNNPHRLLKHWME